MPILLARFRKDDRGIVAVIFAFALVPLLGMVGAAVDYSAASAKKARLQAATDAVALALVPMTLESTDEQLLRQGQKVFKAVMPEGDPNLVKIEVRANRSELVVKAGSGYSTRFVRILGQEGVQIAASSTAKVSNLTYEIALVLDNSSSMAQMAGGRSKMDAAKEAAKGLVETVLQTPGMKNRTQVAVVPYTSAVNVGAEYRNASWVDTQGASKIHWGENITRPTGAKSRFTLFDWVNEPWGGCFESRPDGMAFTDEAPSGARPDSLFVPMFAPDEPGNKLATSYSSQTVRNSYLNDDGEGACGGATLPTAWRDRQKVGCKYKINQDPNKIAYTMQWGIRTGPNFMCNAVKMLRMSNTLSTVKTKIDEMTAVGDTSIFEGVAWGWRTLSPNLPFQDGRAYGKVDNRKVLILLSDGNNNWLQQSNANKSLYSPMGFWVNDRLTTGLNDQAVANNTLDAKTKEVCRNAKTSGVIIYTVGLKLSGQSLPPSWSDLITECASDVEGKRQAFIAESGDAIVEIFREIAQNILKPRIAG